MWRIIQGRWRFALSNCCRVFTFSHGLFIFYFVLHFNLLMYSYSLSCQTSEWGGVEEAGGLLQSFIKAQRRLAEACRLWHSHQPTTHHQRSWGWQQSIQLEPPHQPQPRPREPVRPPQGQLSSCAPQGKSPGGAGAPSCRRQSFVRRSPTGRRKFLPFIAFSSLFPPPTVYDALYKSYNLVTPWWVCVDKVFSSISPPCRQQSEIGKRSGPVWPSTALRTSTGCWRRPRPS